MLNNALPSTRKEAQETGAKRYFTGVACPNGHLAERYTTNGTCCECNAIKKTQWHAQNPDKKLAYDQAWRAQNPEKVAASLRRAYLRDPQKVIARVKEWEQANPEKSRKLRRTVAVRRFAAERLRVPVWLTKEDHCAIAAKYAEAQWMTVRTGIKHHVDHFYPLQGKKVSGLHTPANLRVIPSRENWRKHNALPTAERLPL